jgi:hypothetical protein
MSNEETKYEENVDFLAWLRPEEWVIWNMLVGCCGWNTKEKGEYW